MFSMTEQGKRNPSARSSRGTKNAPCSPCCPPYPCPRNFLSCMPNIAERYVTHKICCRKNGNAKARDDTRKKNASGQRSAQKFQKGKPFPSLYQHFCGEIVHFDIVLVMLCTCEHSYFFPFSDKIPIFWPFCL